MKFPFYIIPFLLIAACSNPSAIPVSQIVEEAPFINGNDDYLKSPYVTAGNRVYMVGHQDGTFPDLGWHIKGEMGGIWDHPIKLMDGFDAELEFNGQTLQLNNAKSFVNYPFANKHVFEFLEKGLIVERYQYVPDGIQGLLVQFVITNNSSQKLEGLLKFTGHTNLRPTWLGERTNMVDNEDLGSFEDTYWMVKDVSNPWFNVFGSEQSPKLSLSHENQQNTNGRSNSLIYNMGIPSGSTFVQNIFIAGSYTSKKDALKNYRTLQNQYISLLESKKSRYQQLASQSKLTIPNKKFQQAFEWLKYNCDWLVRTVPEIGIGIGAGIPDYPWWFGVDSEYALKGYMAIGQEEIVEKTIQLLDSVSMAINGNGRILHEMSTNGAVFNKGNINETPQFASLIWEIYSWNGDQEFLKKHFPTVQKGLQWLLEENDANQNLFPDGFGMMEIHGLNSEMIDVASYSQKAFEDAAKMANALNKSDLEKEYEELASQLRQKINAEFWSEEFGSYADFIGTDEQALHLIEDALIRADTLNKPWAIEELKATREQILEHPSSSPRPFVLHHNWVVNTPMEMGIADTEKALIALDNAKRYTNPFGIFVTGIDRDETAGMDSGSFKGSKVFSYTGAVMTLPTGVQAVAENNYGRPDEALDYLNRMVRTFSYALPGSIYEVSPDYGMMIQAWNIYAFAVPIVKQFFGIHPKAYDKIVEIEPQMPMAWDDVSLENVKIGDNEVSIWYERSDHFLQIKVHQTKPGWQIRLVLPNTGYSVSDENADIQSSDGKTIITTSELEIEVTKN